MLRIVELPPLGQHRVGQFRTNGLRKKFVGDDPLVVPLDCALGFFKNLSCIPEAKFVCSAVYPFTAHHRDLIGKFINHSVMKPLEGKMKLRNHQIFIVPSIGDHGQALLISLPIIANGPSPGL